MPRIELKITGLDKLGEKLKELAPKIHKEVRTAMYDFGELVMDESYAVCPWDTGALINSGHVEMHPEIPAGGIPAFTFEPKQEARNVNEAVVTLGYGGTARGYALYVHENLDPDVNWSRPGSGPKYLENPYKAHEHELPDRIREAVGRAVK